MRMIMPFMRFSVWPVYMRVYNIYILSVIKVKHINLANLATGSKVNMRLKISSGWFQNCF